MSNIGRRIVALRAERGIEQQTLAKLAGMSQGHLSAIESDPKISPRLATLQKIANALEVPVDTLTTDFASHLAENDSLEWFWRRRFSVLRPSEILEYRARTPGDRVVWTLKTLLDHFPGPEIAGRMQLTEEHLGEIISGQAVATGTIVDLLVERTDVPENWLLNGDPGAPDPLLRKLLQHRDAGAYLAFVCRAIDERIVPELLERQMDLMLSIRNSEKPPT